MKHSLFLFILTTFCLAQSPAIQWAKTYGGVGFDQAYSVIQTTDGGYIVAGSTDFTNTEATNFHGGTDFWVVKILSTGTVQWQKCYGGSLEDVAYCIQQTTDGGYIIAGSTVSTDGDVTGLHPSPGNPLWGDYWIVKIDNAGILQWQKTLGGSGFDEAHSIRQTADGGYIVAGLTNSGDGDFDNGGNIVKLSATGEIEWHHYQGGSFNYSVNQTADGGYIVAGTILNQFSVLKLDSLGAQQWWKFYGSGAWDQANGAIQTSDGGYMIAGYVEAGDGDVTGYHGGATDGWLLKLDGDGELEWQKTIGGSYDDEAASIKQTADGGYIVAGMTDSNDGDVSGLHGTAGANSVSTSISDFWVVKLNSTGTIQWQKTMGGSYIDKGTDIALTTDGGYIVAGNTVNNIVNSGDVTGFHLNTSLPNASGYDFWVVKLAPDLLSVPESAKSLVRVYPNPTRGLVHVEGLGDGLHNVKLVDEKGCTLTDFGNTAAKDFDMAGLAAGLYFLRIDGDAVKIVRK